MSGLRVLMLGVGYFGRKWLKEISACPQCELVGIVAKHSDLLAMIGEEFKVPPSRRFATIEEGLDRSQAQAVIVALPAIILACTLGAGAAWKLVGRIAGRGRVRDLATVGVGVLLVVSLVTTSLSEPSAVCGTVVSYLISTLPLPGS